MATEGEVQLQVGKKDDYCCVPRCNGNGRIHLELSFHHFPSEKKREFRKKWIHAIRRDEGPFFKIGKNTVVCSRHFTAEDYRWTLVRKCLKPDVVPSVFEWNTGKPDKLPRKPPTERKILAERTNNAVDIEISLTHSDDEQNFSKQDPEIASNEISVLAHGDENNNGGKLEILEQHIQEKEDIIKAKDKEIEELRERLRIEKFGVNRFSFDDDMIDFYTGFYSYELFLAFFEFIKPSVFYMKSVYYNVKNDHGIRGRPKSLEPIDELFMFLCRVRCGFLSEDLAVRFNIHKSSVSRKLITWANFLYLLLGSINIWPNRDKIQIHMPEDFKLLYPNTRIIIDCTEIYTERPSSLALGSKTFSSYKSHNTWKGLVGIAPHGAVTFISSLYSGCISDVAITEHSGLIELLEPGDQIMADKGFVLDRVLTGSGVSIATPHFLCADGQFTQSQIEDNQKIASLRIHVERHIKKVKEYRLFNSVIPLSIAGSVNQLWTVVNILTLFKRPLIKKKN
ncbi:hypothetical protein FSP39_008144 [Pinctada imbricata]|uniref:THAP-type domain-containing protein n=1 Tax=Pinctada imbricata TaxID=66713 RepID=A0AA89C3G4_PINIB|nr:hypothetical protein FSP39_008144 [Pinctada imbricata]